MNQPMLNIWWIILKELVSNSRLIEGRGSRTGRSCQASPGPTPNDARFTHHSQSPWSILCVRTITRRQRVGVERPGAQRPHKAIAPFTATGTRLRWGNAACIEGSACATDEARMPGNPRSSLTKVQSHVPCPSSSGSVFADPSYPATRFTLPR